MSVNKYNTETGKLELIAGGLLYADSPVGSIVPYGGTTAPNGWLICQGQAVSRTGYADLFSVIGTAFGTGDGSTTFNLPDLRETVPVGIGENNSQTIANHDVYTLGEFKDDQMQDHDHKVKRTGLDGGSAMEGIVNWSNGGSAANTSPASINTTTRTGTTTHGKQLGVNYIIKAKQTPVPTDFADSMIGYLGQETNYNLYPWSHVRTVETADDNQDITIERDGWYSIDYTLSSGVDITHTFTLRDFDNQGDVHTIMRAHYDKSGTFRQTFLIPLKAGTYRYSHGGIGTLSVYMNRRDFA